MLTIGGAKQRFCDGTSRLSAPAKVPTLIDDVGCFLGDHFVDEMVAGVNLDELEEA